MKLEDSVIGERRFAADILITDTGWIINIINSHYSLVLLITGGLRLMTLSADPVTP